MPLCGTELIYSLFQSSTCHFCFFCSTTKKLVYVHPHRYYFRSYSFCNYLHSKYAFGLRLLTALLWLKCHYRSTSYPSKSILLHILILDCYISVEINNYREIHPYALIPGTEYKVLCYEYSPSIGSIMIKQGRNCWSMDIFHLIFLGEMGKKSFHFPYSIPAHLYPKC